MSPKTRKRKLEQATIETAVEKRARPATKRTRKTGPMSVYMSLPSDMFLEICGHLEPLDLLHLIRTCKTFKDVLLRKSSVSVWENSCSKLAFPSCPEDLQLPQFADLLVGDLCTVREIKVPLH
ncbi:hypothetical protein FA15DRAFT_638748 [Coprinopsis marcescibilis]|uniref:F-box domain-containing protein n=1 Tax=Coprinopsis marcescibilis TaxID=230819 RepID=A0A5C3KZE4_COPMA|nr:hypothetical protein FA15DRAFT_638748 [Coprinopsis marcescibilis]